MKRKTTEMELLEARDAHGRSIEAILADAYDQAGTQNGAAELLGLDKSTFSRWVRSLGMARRLVAREPVA
jgi:transcriptional regulator of acetoin/glycerol metabolism